MLERSATADVFKNTLSRIPTLFGRIEYLASLRDPNSGAYRHHGLAAIFGREESRRALSQSHEAVFREWLNLPLEEKREDLSEYLKGLDEPRAVVLRHWAKRCRLPRLYAGFRARQRERTVLRRIRGFDRSIRVTHYDPPASSRA